MSETTPVDEAFEAPEAPEGALEDVLLGDEAVPAVRRRKRTIVLLVAAFVVLVAGCLVGSVVVTGVVHRDPPPDLRSDALADAFDGAAEQTAAAAAVVRQRDTVAVGTAQDATCYKGSHWSTSPDDFDWLCATRQTEVLAIAQTGLEQAVSAAQDQLVRAGWTVASDRVAAGRSRPFAENAAAYDKDGTRVTLSFGRAAPDSVSAAVRLQYVDVGTASKRHWDLASSTLEESRLAGAATRPADALIVVTAQRTWFRN
ncbi:hypothetical protein [Cryptosporangium sp. NPDC051539]|uniref:hypothetical protein n=1 Tax=Cryptosporangium sp. NPDC051539 TaxID=3363962 RepID=UPI003787EB3B